MAPPLTITVKVLEECRVHPPPVSAPPGTSLRLTFFDIPWLLFFPTQPLFFYKLAISAAHFASATLPALKHSLALALRHYHPLAGKLTFSPEPAKPEIVYTDGDYVSVTVAEADGDFDHLSGHHPRDASEFHSLVPQLSSSASREKLVLPLLAVQITIFENSGLCIGLAYHHVAGDGRTFNNFMKSWAATSRLGHDNMSASLPFYDRTVVTDPRGLEAILLKQWWAKKSFQEEAECTEDHKINEVSDDDLVRATFVVSPNEMDRIKKWIIAQCKQTNHSSPLLLSAYVVTCAFVWVCLSKARKGKTGKEINEDPNYFGFIAGGMTRLDYPIPATYFGNCVAFGRAVARWNELVGSDGIVVAAEAIGSTIKTLNREVLGGAEKWISDWEVFSATELHLMVSGSPKVDLYGTDFGWGRPSKIEDVSIDKKSAISLTESRDVKGGIEVGLVLPTATMDAFTSIFAESLKAFP